LYGGIKVKDRIGCSGSSVNPTFKVKAAISIAVLAENPISSLRGNDA
jgi:hypothetical protein